MKSSSLLFILVTATLAALLAKSGTVHGSVHRIPVARTMRLLLKKIVATLTNIYNRVKILRSDISDQSIRQNGLENKLKALEVDINVTNDKITESSNKTEFKLDEVKADMLKKIDEFHDKLKKIITDKTNQFKFELTLVNDSLTAEKISMNQLQTELAEGHFKINQTLHQTTSPFEGTVRLEGGGLNPQGRVQFFYFNTWTYICDSHWTKEDAQVVCSMLGYSPRISVAYTSKLKTNVLIDNIVCKGDEKTLGDCPHTGWKVHNCDIMKVAAVNCQP